MIKAPWTGEQVDALNRHQGRYDLHPYTCENYHGKDVERRTLVATVRGWICRYCDYQQDWAHDLPPPPRDGA